MQRKYHLGLSKFNKKQSVILGGIFLMFGIIWLWQVLSEPDNTWKLILGVAIFFAGILHLAQTYLGNSSYKNAPKIMIDEEEILLKPGLSSQIIRLPWKGLRYVHVNKDKLSVQLAHNNEHIHYRIKGRFSEEAINDLKETAKRQNVQFGS